MASVAMPSAVIHAVGIVGNVTAAVTLPALPDRFPVMLPVIATVQVVTFARPF